MRIVVLERNSVGTDIDITCYEKLGSVIYYDNMGKCRGKNKMCYGCLSEYRGVLTR